MNRKCRTCSREDHFVGKSVNAFSESHKEPIYMMLIYCTQLQYSVNDTLPQQICPECLVLLDGAFTFWKQCRQTDANLRYGMLGNLLASSDLEVQEVAPTAVAETPVTAPTAVAETPVTEPTAVAETPVTAPTAVAETPVTAPTAVAETPVTAQSLWCCFRKCPKVTTSLADLEQHGKLHHFTERISNEVLQKDPGREYICSVCNSGFSSLGSYEYHRMIQLGTRQNGRASASVINKQQQEEEEPSGQLEAVETSVVKEELQLDDCPEDTVMEFEAEEFKVDEIQDECMDEASSEEQAQVLLNTLMIKLAEAFAKTQDHFQIPLTNKEYFTLRERARILRRFKKAAISRYKKWMHLIIICNGCKFHTNISLQMQQHLGKKECKTATLSYALATYNPSVRIFVCVQCGYETNDSYIIRRHQRVLGHEGIDISRPKTTSKSNAEAETSTSTSISPIQFDIVPVKDEPYNSEEDESSQDVEVPETEPPALQDNSGSTKTTTPQCNTCLKKSKTGNAKDKHAEFCTKSRVKAKLTCPKCSTVFYSKYKYGEHIGLCDSLIDPNQCKDCFIKFPDKPTLKRHRKVGCTAILNAESSGIKTNYSCEHCGKGFVNKRLLRLHKIVDGCGERRVSKLVEGKSQCPYCFHQFARTDLLRRHMDKYCLVLLKKQAEVDRAAAAAAAAQDSSLTNVPASTGS